MFDFKLGFLCNVLLPHFIFSSRNKFHSSFQKAHSAAKETKISFSTKKSRKAEM
jgi:hypothetical protein